MIFSNATWSGPSIDDTEIFVELPKSLTELLLQRNGFIVHSGALHVRGAVVGPTWHSLRHAWRGTEAFSVLYDEVRPSDIPFAQDMVGDQFLLRQDRVLRLIVETGEIEEIADSLRSFWLGVEEDIEGYLNLSLQRFIRPGELLFAFPPFFVKESAQGDSKLKACPADEVIRIHADFARQVRDVPDGGTIEFRIK
jgi:hypothetical protein